jgi:glycosyltransferase involved in cell wall biosynthesis
MKIILLGTAYPFRGGLAAYNERLMREFQKEGHDVEIVTFTLQYPGFLFPGETQYADWEAPKDIFIKKKLNSVNPLNWIKTAKYIKNQKPDILIIKYWLPFMGPAFGTVAKIVKRNKYTRIVSILDNIIPHEHRVGDKLFSKYFVSAVDAFVGMSKSVLDDLNQFTIKKPRAFNPHPLFDNFGDIIDKKEAADFLNLDFDKTYLLFFGLIRDYKGLDLLLEAMADARIKEKNIQLIVAGEFYSDAQPYLDLISKYELQDNIILHDKFIPDPEVKYYFSIADLVVQPYKSATQSGVTQIAYQFEKPMIVTNVGGLSEIVPDNKVGFVVDVNPTAIADAICLFFDENKATAFQPFIKQEKEKYSWSRMTETILSLVKKIKQ